MIFITVGPVLLDYRRPAVTVETNNRRGRAAPNVSSFGCLTPAQFFTPGKTTTLIATESHPEMTPKTTPPEPVIPDAGADRRKRNIPVAIDRRRQNAAEKRRTSERRRLIDPTTCERDYNDDETAFMKAMERYKRENRRPFPTWSEVLEVLVSLGYRKVAPEGDLPGIKRDAPPKG